jgi:uncharacterized damage-inducible protein DinB
MSVTVSLEQLLDYTDFERAKWRTWIETDPSRLTLPFQPGGRFPTIGSLLDHVFLVERRHLSRLQGSTPPDSSGVAAGDWPALMEYAALVRADLRTWVNDATDADAATDLAITVASGGPYTMTKRALATHMLLHEIRHFAQVAFAARLGGAEPPGQHDYFYFAESA